MEPIPEGQNRMPVDIQVTDPLEKVLYSLEDAKEGKFAFTTSLQGDYIVCFHNKGLPELKTVRRVKLDMKHGIDAQDYSKVTCPVLSAFNVMRDAQRLHGVLCSQVIKADHLTGVQTSLRKIEDRVEQIRHEFQAQKDREKELRDLSEQTCERIGSSPSIVLPIHYAISGTQKTLKLLPVYFAIFTITVLAATGQSSMRLPICFGPDGCADMGCFQVLSKRIGCSTTSR